MCVCVCVCSSWDEYAAEVKSGRLDWSPVHRSDKFWVREMLFSGTCACSLYMHIRYIHVYYMYMYMYIVKVPLTIFV